MQRILQEIMQKRFTLGPIEPAYYVEDFRISGPQHILSLNPIQAKRPNQRDRLCPLPKLVPTKYFNIPWVLALCTVEMLNFSMAKTCGEQ